MYIVGDGFPSPAIENGWIPRPKGQTVNLLQIASVVRIHLHPLSAGSENALYRLRMVCQHGGIGRRKA